MFNRLGVITYPRDKGSEDAMLEAAIEAGADECVTGEEMHEFLCNVENFGHVRDGLEERLGAAEGARIEWRPQNSVMITDENGESLVKLLDVLEDHDDVQSVYGNYELSDALIAKLAA
jgi:transcriptional/translational regulatory protein YebC/TACO1